MAENSRVITVTLKTIADIKDALSNAKQLQQAFSGLQIPKNLGTQFERIIANIEKNVNKASDAMASGFKSKGDVTAYTNATNQIVSDWQKIAQIVGSIDGSKLNFDMEAGQVAALSKEIEQLKTEIDEINTKNLEAITDVFERRTKPEKHAKAWGEFFEAFQKGEDGIEDAEKALKRLQAQVTKAEKAAGGRENLNEAWKQYAADVDVYTEAIERTKNKTGEAEQKQAQLDAKLAEQVKLQEEANAKGTKWLEDLKQGAKESAGGVKQLVGGLQESAQGTQNLNSELDQMKHRIQYFFGLNNAVRLFQRALRSAFDTIKDLDKVMTETAVVTKFDVSDMWSQLPEYTKRANELGITIHDAYEAATLYYQQGLSTNEVMAVSNETLKMARIAGLDAADATDRMTNALRGFNMEITESNAQNINDVYSNLAAKTASNVDEISTAMTKVASLANNANMSFENTAAFLSQIIETTRESAETAGTALKTVIARFSEVKDLYNEGDLLGVDAEGEEIDVNKVSKALRTAGINLNEYLTGMKGLDDIFMELSAKWDSLDQVQQRYIATMAAGSRQQSRFIALMQDNARMTELVKEANNAAGASQGQFEKTLESLETKLNQLQNAWKTFIMGIADDSAIKFVIDLLTDLISVVNKLTKDMPGLLKSITNIGIVFGGLKLGKGILNKLLPGLGPSLFGKGKEAGTAFTLGFKNSLEHNGTVFNKKFWADLIRVPPVDTSNIDAITIAIKKENLALEELNEVKGTVAALEANEISFAEASADINIKEAMAEYNAAAATEAKALALEKAGLSQEQYDRLLGLGLTQEEIAIVVNKKGKQSLDEKTDAEIREMFAEEANYKAKQKGIIGSLAAIVHTKAETIANNKNTASIFREVAAWIAKKTAIDATIPSMLAALGIVGLIIAAVGALVFGIIKLIKAIINSTPEAKLKAAKQAAEEAAEAADKAAEAYKNLGDSFDSLGEKYKTIEELTRGTREWRDAAQEVNQEVLKLLETYPELGAFIENKGGVLTIDFESASVQAIMDKYANTSVVAASNSILAQQNVVARQLNTYKGSKFNKFKGSSFTGDNVDVYVDEGIRDLIAKAIAGDVEATSWFANRGVSKREEFESKEDYGRRILDYINHLGDAINVSDNTIQALEEYGQALIEADSTLEGLNTAMAGNIISTLDLTEEEAEYAQNFLSRDKLDSVIENWENELANWTGKDFTSNEGEYRKYFKEKYGNDFKGTTVTGTVSYRNEEGKTVELKAEDAKREFIAAKATEEATKETELFVKNLKNANKSVKDLFSKKEGKGLTKADIEELTGSSFQEVLAEGAEELLNNVSLQGYAEELGVSINELVKSVWIAVETFNNASNQLVDDEAQQILENSNAYKYASAGGAAGLTSNISNILASSGLSGVQAVMSAINSFTEGMKPDEIEKFVDALKLIDWKNLDDVEDLSETLENLGISVDKDSPKFKTLTKAIEENAHSIRQVDTEHLKEIGDKLGAVGKKIEEGTNSFTEDEYNTIIGLDSSLSSGFFKDMEGNFQYLGGTMDELRVAIQKNTKALTGSGQLDALISAGKLVDTITVAVEDVKNEDSRRATVAIQSAEGLEGYETWTPELQKAWLEAFIQEASSQGIDLGQLGISKLSSDTEVDNINPDDLSEILGAIQEVKLAVGTNETKKAEEDAETIRTYQGFWTAEENAAAIDDTDEGELHAKALLLQAQATGVAADELDRYKVALKQGNTEVLQLEGALIANITSILKQAESLDIDKDALIRYARHLIDIRDNLEDTEDTAWKVAIANTKLNKGLGEVIGSYEDWTSLINKDGIIEVANSDDVETFNKLKDSVNMMLNTTVPLSDSFWNSKENLELLKKAAEGSATAFGELQKKAAISYIEDNIDHSTKEGKDAIESFISFLKTTELPALEPGMELEGVYKDYQKFIRLLNDMSEKTGASVEDINEIFGDLGYTVDVKYKTIESAATLTIPNGSSLKDFMLKDEGFIKPTVKKIKSKVKIPILSVNGNDITSTGSGGAGISSENLENGKGNGDSGKKKSDKPSYWKNPFDELFNLQEKINEAMRKREALERKYQKLLKSTSASIADIRKGYFDQIKQMRQQIKLQKQLARGRLGQINNLGNQYYVDSNGKRRTFASMGVTQYAHYNQSTGLIEIDWEGLEKLASNPKYSDKGAAAEEYINLLQQLVDSYEETRDAIWEIEDAIEDLTQEAIDSYISFEDRVMQAVIQKYEKQIEKLEDMNDAINDATNSMIDAIREQIRLERQARENAKTEQSIAEKEARLAYLRRDTSGANDLEIMQLEKELEEMRQDYSDSLVDQAIDELQNQADQAAEQREQQIEIMRAQLEIAQENGSLWNEVYDLINNATDSDGVLRNNSMLVRLLKETEAYRGMSAFASDEWMKKLREEFNAAMGGLAAGGATSAGQHEGGASGSGSGSSSSSGGSGGSSGGTGSGDFPYGKASETYGVIKLGARDSGDDTRVKAIQWALKGLKWKGKDGKPLAVDGIFGENTEYALKGFQNKRGITADGVVGDETRKKFALMHYKKGGLVDFTGPAWLDGSRSNPEMVLNAQDTQNLIKIKDILSRFMGASSTNNTPSGNTYVSINVDADIDSDYSVDQLIERIKQDLYKDGSYRNVNMLNFLR